jgi:hypothetical protein
MGFLQAAMLPAHSGMTMMTQTIVPTTRRYFVDPADPKPAFAAGQSEGLAMPRKPIPAQDYPLGPLNGQPAFNTEVRAC